MFQGLFHLEKTKKLWVGPLSLLSVLFFQESGHICDSAYFLTFHHGLIIFEADFISVLNAASLSFFSFFFNPTSSFRARLQRSMLKRKLLSVETPEVTSIPGPHLFLPVPLPHAAVLSGSLPALAAVSPASLQLEVLVMSSFKPHCPLITVRACWDCCFFPSLQDVMIKESAHSLLDTGRLLSGSETCKSMVDV